MLYRRLWPFVLLFSCFYPIKQMMGCEIPVFRYALENWRQENYEVILFHQGSLPAEAQELLAYLQKAEKDPRTSVNLSTHVVDLSAPAEKRLLDIWESQQNATTPWMVVGYPPRLGIKSVIWNGPPSREVVDSLLDSPARKEIARRLLEGESAVWLLLESGDKNKDDAAEVLLNRELTRLEKEVKLPHESPKPGGDAQQVPAIFATTAPQLLSKIPLRIKFSVLRVSRSDPKESMFVSLLLRADKGLASEKGTLVFPVFGRGRAMEISFAGQLDADTIEMVSRFLCGACSCDSKGDRPGVDLLLSVNWDALIKEGGKTTAKAPAPPGDWYTKPPERAVAYPSVAEDRPEDDGETEKGDLLRRLLYGAAAVVSLLVVATGARLVWQWRNSHSKNTSQDNKNP